MPAKLTLTVMHYPPVVFKALLCAIGSCLLFLAPLNVRSQTDSTQQKIVRSFNSISGKALNAIDNKYSLLQKLIERKTARMLSRMQKREADLEIGMQGKDSIKAQQLFAGAQARYQQLSTQLKAPVNTGNIPIKQYYPAVDSVQAAMGFLKQGANIPGISSEKLFKITAISAQLQQLQASLQNATNAQDFVTQREQQLKAQLMRYGMAGKLIGVNKEVFYYQQQLSQYKSMLNDKQQLEEAVLSTVQKIPAFQNYWQKYSYLSAIFPQTTIDGVIQQPTGLQKKSDIGEIILAKVQSASPNGSGQSPLSALQAQLARGQAKISEMKDMVSNFRIGDAGSSNMSMPAFEPNSQHNKKLLDRFEVGFNIQNNQATSALPVISTLGLSLGYLVNDKVTAGIGAAYLLGLGSDFEHLHLSNQGASLRSFIDIKAKGGFWITGGYEYTYMQQFTNLHSIRNFDLWQKSALIGISKKYLVGKKQANVQLLFNMLYAQDIPQSQPIIFRVGYSL
jgi:hypothetical protein